MTYEWQEGWVDIADVPDQPEYVARSRRAVMGAINWIAEHPKAEIRYRQRNLQKLAEEAGYGDVPVNQIFFSGEWRDYIKPDTSDCRQLCRAIEQATIAGDDERATPTFSMMRKAMLCAKLFNEEGWEKFSAFMFSHDTEGSA